MLQPWCVAGAGWVRERRERSSPLVVARLDYRVGVAWLELPATASQGEVVPLRCGVRDDEGVDRPGHVIRLEVTGPDGEARSCYSAMLRGEGAERSWRIPFALNDLPGEWRVAVTDVISGESQTATIRLQTRD